MRAGRGLAGGHQLLPNPQTVHLPPASIQSMMSRGMWGGGEQETPPLLSSLTSSSSSGLGSSHPQGRVEGWGVAQPCCTPWPGGGKGGRREVNTDPSQAHALFPIHLDIHTSGISSSSSSSLLWDSGWAWAASTQARGAAWARRAMALWADPVSPLWHCPNSHCSCWLTWGGQKGQ